MASNSYIFLCNRCQAHIARKEDLLHRSSETAFVLIRHNLNNVVVDGEGTVNCVNCGNLLGTKAVDPAFEHNNLNMYFLSMNQLVIRNEYQLPNSVVIIMGFVFVLCVAVVCADLGR